MSTFYSLVHGPILRTYDPKVASGWERTGLIVLRAYNGDLFTPREYQEIMKGGKRYLGQFHRPSWVLKQAQKILDNLCVDRREFHNIACNAGRTQILNYIGNNLNAANIATYPGSNVFAIGNGNVTGTPPAATDTQLLSEFTSSFPGRIAASGGGSYGAGVSGNTVDINALFTTAQANGTYTEAGVFAVSGTLPGSTNSGVLFAHAVYNYTKTSAVSLSNDYFISLN